MTGSKAPSLRETLLRVRHENAVLQQAGKPPTHAIARDPKYKIKGTPPTSPEPASLQPRQLAAIPTSRHYDFPIGISARDALDELHKGFRRDVEAKTSFACMADVLAEATRLQLLEGTSGPMAALGCIALVLTAWDLIILQSFDPMPFAQPSHHWAAVEDAYNALLRRPGGWRDVLRRYGKGHVKLWPAKR